MADSLTVTAKLTASFDGETYANTQTSSPVTLESGSDCGRVFTQAIGTSWEAFDVGDIDTSKRYWLYVRNLDDTNFVTVAFKTAVTPTYGPDHVLYPGESMVLPCEPYSTGYPIAGATADTAACNCQVVLSDAGDPTA